MPDLEFWLTELRRRGWYLHTFGDNAKPTLLAATWHWPDCADVVLIRAQDNAVAYRTADPDPFAPEWVSWVYGACAVWTLRAALTVGPPQHLPQPVMTAPHTCRIPVELRMPVTVRPLLQ